MPFPFILTKEAWTWSNQCRHIWPLMCYLVRPHPNLYTNRMTGTNYLSLLTLQLLSHTTFLFKYRCYLICYFKFDNFDSLVKPDLPIATLHHPISHIQSRNSRTWTKLALNIFSFIFVLDITFTHIFGGSDPCPHCELWLETHGNC